MLKFIAGKELRGNGAVGRTGREHEAGVKKELNVARTNHGGKGFTLIEVMIALSILALLVAIGLFTYLSTAKRIKLQADVRSVNGALQLARMRAISSGISTGVAFWRRSTSSANLGNPPDAYFVFVDCNNDLVYTDNNDDPTNNYPITTWDKCNSVLGYDPILQGQKIQYLTPGDYFTYIFGSKNKTQAKKSAKLEFVVFNSLGQAMWGSSLVSGDTNIFIQDRRTRGGGIDRSGIVMYGASGLTDIIPTGAGATFSP